MKTLFCFLIFFLVALPAQAYEKIFSRHCKAANVPREIAMAIARQESGLNPNCVNVAGEDHFPATRAEAEKIIKRAAAENKSYDVGLMQINSQWIKKWKIDPCSLLDPDANIRAGIRILSEEIKRHGMNWKAVGAYHSPTPARAMQYANQVFGRMKGKTALNGMVPSPRLQVLIDKGIITRAEARHMLSNMRLNGNLSRARLKALKAGLMPRRKGGARSALAEYMRERKSASAD